MAYIGNTQLNQNYVPAVDFFSGNGSTTAFTLSRPVASSAAIQATISNVPQDPGTAFTVSGSTITFTSAPPSGTNNIYVYYTSPNTQVVQPGQGTVGATQIDGNYALWNKSGSDINYTAGNVGVGVTPSAWRSDYKAIEIGSLGNAIGTNVSAGNTLLSSNGYYDGSWRYARTGSYATLYNSQSSTGSHLWYTAPSGTAGNAISFTQAMTLDSSGNLQFNSGYGSVATAYGCRAWVNFNGTGTVAIRASGNVSSITDNGTGDYTVNFTNAMPDANYSINATGYYPSGSFAFFTNNSPSYLTSASARIETVTHAGATASTDFAFSCVSIFR